jgi:beta-galactosidase
MHGLVQYISAGMVFLLTVAAAVPAAFVAPATNRVEMNVNMTWKYQLGTVSGTPQAVSFSDAAWQTVSVPHPLQMFTPYLDSSQDCDCTQPTFDRTVGWFRKHFSLAGQSGKKIFVDFETIMQVATVYVNGTLVGTHQVSGYDEFFYDITPYVNFTGDNVMAVYVDNTVNANTPPDDNYHGICTGFPDGIDYILFGGINGDVTLKCTDSLHIGFNQEAKNAGIVVTTPTLSATSGTVQIVTTVKNEHLTAQAATVTATILDANNNVVTTMTSSQKAISPNSSSTFTLLSSSIPEPNLWSPSNPYLYRVFVSVSNGTATVDGKYQKFGFRWYAFNTTTGFSLNGQPLKLIGENRHSAWPFVGGAIPHTVQVRDVKQIKAAGFNFVRTCHYPHDPGFLDALDSIGLLATEEPPTWAPGDSTNIHTNEATWMANLETAFTNEIRRDINHPSTIIWNCIINHGSCLAALQNIATVEDPSRQQGFCQVAEGMCYDMDPNEAVETGGGFCNEYIGFRCPVARFDNDSEQALVTQWHLRMVNLSKATASNAGIADWCMYDYNSFHSSGYHACGYPGTYTQANRDIVYHGIADIYRIPKFPYYWYQTELTTTPLVFIANNWTATSPKTVTIYSNCQQIQLFRNGTSLGTASPATGDSVSSLLHPPFYFRNVTYAAGTLIALGYNNGAVVATDTVRTPGSATQLQVTSDADTLLADGADFCRIIVSVCDANGTVVPTAVNSISAVATGSGTIISTNPIKAEAGKIIFLAQSDTVPGTISVTVTSGSLASAGLSLTVIGSPATAVKNNFHAAELQGPAQFMEKWSCVDGKYRIPGTYAKTMKTISMYDLQGKLVYSAPIRGAGEIDLPKGKNSGGVLLVRLLNH